LKHDTSEAAIHASDGLDTLANLAILGESESLPGSSPVGSHVQTTRHPRHRPGCSCIVCIQPPSGKGPKHKQSCSCNVCNTVRRRFRTLMMRRGEKRQSESSSDSPTCPTTPTAPISPQPGSYVGDVGPKVQSGIAVDVGPSPSGSAVAGMILLWCVAFFITCFMFFRALYKHVTFQIRPTIFDTFSKHPILM
jgi:hypothetical protein